MRKMKLCILLSVLYVVLIIPEVRSATISMDTMTNQSQSTPYGTIVNESYITPYGSISFSDGGTIPESNALWFYHDGAYMSTDYAVFNFDFDVDAISFNAWGGNGGIYTVAYDINNNEVDSIINLDFLANTPVSLSGSGIRSLVLADGRYITMGGGGNVEIKNVMITTSAPVAPEPISSILFVTGGTLLAGRRFIRRKA